MKPAKKVKTHWIESFCQTRATNSNHLDQQWPCFPEGQKLKWQIGLKSYSKEQTLVSNTGINNDSRISRIKKTGTSWITLPNKRHQHPILQKTLPKKFGRSKTEFTKLVEVLCRNNGPKIRYWNKQSYSFPDGRGGNYEKNWEPMQNKRYYHQWLGTPIYRICGGAKQQNKSFVENVIQTRKTIINHSK